MIVMLLKRWLVGDPLKSTQAAHERLSKTLALAIFSSNAISSVAYATEEIAFGGVLAPFGARGFGVAPPARGRALGRRARLRPLRGGRGPRGPSSLLPPSLLPFLLSSSLPSPLLSLLPLTHFNDMKGGHFQNVKELY